MNVERFVKEYLHRKALLDRLTAEVTSMKEVLSKQVDKEGTPDENGHRWLTAGKYSLQRQKRQGKRFLDKQAAETWAREHGFWDEVKVVREELDEDKLLGYVYEHRHVPGIEDKLNSLHVTPNPTWAFMSPVEQENYDY